jgi:hypothetical protein
MALPAPPRRIVLNVCCFSPPILLPFEQGKDRRHAKTAGIALVGIVLRARNHLVDGRDGLPVEFAQHFAVTARHADNRTGRPPLDHGVHDARVDDVVGQGVGRLAGIVGARGDLGDGAKRLIHLRLMRGVYSRWLRLLVAQAIGEMARSSAKPPRPVLFLLDEFAALGRLQPVERAMGLMAGYGLQLWPILQDLHQLRSLYGKNAGTFLSNAGVLQAFGVKSQLCIWLSI